MFLITTGSLLNVVAAECWKVPDSLGIERTGAVEDLKITLNYEAPSSRNLSYSDHMEMRRTYVQ